MGRIIKDDVIYYTGTGDLSDTLFEAPTCSCCNKRSAKYNGTFCANKPYFRKVGKDTELYTDKIGEPICDKCFKKDNRKLGKGWAWGTRASSNGRITREYLMHRKDYCENIDGRLGFTCTTTFPDDVEVREQMLDVDHVDEDSTNNNPENLQTLCACCHRAKTNYERDFQSPKKAKILKNMRKVAKKIIIKEKKKTEALAFRNIKLAA